MLCKKAPICFRLTRTTAPRVVVDRGCKPGAINQFQCKFNEMPGFSTKLDRHPNFLKPRIMSFNLSVTSLRKLCTLIIVSCLIVGCATPMPRKDDPLEHFNRKVYAFNDFADRVAIRPAALAYRKMTNPTSRTLVSNFFANIESPITIANDLLQANLKQAIKATGRLAINSTVGVLGLFDPASEMGIEASATDFAVTLAKWGVPEGPYLVLPLIGSTSVRDVWRMPVDGYFFDPLSIYARNHDFNLNVQHLPGIAYLVTLRSRGIDAEGLLEGVYDPYIFYRDAYRQRRMYLIYRGEPPFSVIQSMQGAGDLDDADKLLEEQQQYEKQQQKKDNPDPRH